jgi:alanyl-tRNA synthetase
VPVTEQEKIDVAFRVIADHLRTLSFAIADGIQPGNSDRNYTLRRILRRAVKITAVLKAEEEQFNRTLDRGLKLFDDAAGKVPTGKVFPADTVVKLWETFGFPTDLTQLLLDERSLTTDQDEVSRLVDAHKSTGAEGQKTSVIEAVSIETEVKTTFVGFEVDETTAEVVTWIDNGSGIFAIVDRSPFYIEKGGQLGDTGILIAGGETIPVLSVLGVGEATVLQLEKLPAKETSTVTLKVDTARRRGIEQHHTATHLFHWALHQIVNPDATQQGSLVAPDRLRFDFNSSALEADKLNRIEAEVNRCILSNDPVAVTEVPHAEVKNNKGVMQFFGDKYGDKVRVVQIGGKKGAYDGYSMELCGGTHVRSTGAIGFFKIKSEGAVAAGIRRIEAVCGDAAAALIADEAAAVNGEFAEAVRKFAEANAKLKSLGKSYVEAEAVDNLSDIIGRSLASGDLAGANAHLKQFEAHRDAIHAAAVSAEKAVKKASAGAASGLASQWFEETLSGYKGETWAGLLPGDSAELLQEAMNAVKARQFRGAVAMALVAEGSVHLGVIVHGDFTSRFKAGDIVRESLAVAGGKGGGKPEMARGAAAGGDSEAEAILSKAKVLLT